MSSAVPAPTPSISPPPAPAFLYSQKAVYDAVNKAQRVAEANAFAAKSLGGQSVDDMWTAAIARAAQPGYKPPAAQPAPETELCAKH